MTSSSCFVWLPVDHRLLGKDGHQMPYVLLGDKYARASRTGEQAQHQPCRESRATAPVVSTRRAGMEESSARENRRWGRAGIHGAAF